MRTDAAARASPSPADGTVPGRWWRQLHDPRLRDPVHKLKHDYAVTAVCFSATGNEIYAGGIDNGIQVRRHLRVGIHSLPVR